MASTGIFDNDLILPGVITEIIPDYAQGYDSSAFGTTESVTIIGTAFNGPVGRVVEIFTPEHAKYMFGDSFDSKTRREATLVPEIYDAWERGCRTIYAIRVSGKEIAKDFNFACETNLKLRVNGIFPSNENKDVYMSFETSQTSEVGAGTIKIFKPSYRANMKEKMQGLVEHQNQMLVTEIKLEGYGINKDSRLVDVINIVNGTESNNVLRLAIVNEEGADVTTSSKDAQSLSLGVMFPGLYTIGRDEASAEVTAITEIDFVRSVVAKPHENYQESIWKKLTVNTDVSKAYPLYGAELATFNSLIQNSGVIADSKGEWLKTNGILDKIAKKDTLDYEEVELDEFDLYKRLGSGYAKTAMIKEIDRAGVKHYKVDVPNDNDPNKTLGIMDGIYSMLENHSTDYTVMSNATAETVISGKMPRKSEFKKRRSGVIRLEDNSGTEVISLTAKINPTDFTDANIFNVEVLEDVEELNQEEILTNLKDEKYIRVAALSVSEIANASFVKDGEIALVMDDTTPILTEEDLASVTGELFSYSTKEKKWKALATNELTDSRLIVELRVGMDLKLYAFAKENTTYSVVDLTEDADKYVIGVCDENANVYKVEGKNLTAVVALSTISNANLEEDYTVTVVETLPKLPFVNGTNGSKVVVRSTEVMWMGYDELVSKLNEDTVFSNLFVAELVNPIFAPQEVAAPLLGEGADKGEEYYDTTMYVPYTTSDNFARHLAQHCMYTSLKTYPTHGIIGCSKLNGITLNTIAERASEVLAQDFDLYVKKPNGNNMLNNNNMPYPIGRCISVPFMQYTVTTGNGYNYVSNGSAGYAGMVSTLPADRSSTNQPINIPNLAFDLSNYQLSKLTAKGIVTAKRTTQGLVITDGVTQAPVDSAYRRLSTTKVLNVVDKELRKVIEPYIGLQDNIATKNSMTTAITSVLNKLKENIINYYKFQVVTDPKSARLGIIKIQYTIIPTNEIREVRNEVSVQESN